MCSPTPQPQWGTTSKGREWRGPTYKGRVGRDGAYFYGGRREERGDRKGGGNSLQRQDE